MGKYLVRGIYTPSGLQGAVKEGFGSRENYIRGLMESMGAKVESWYWAYGQDDLFVTVEAEESVALALSIAVNESGSVHISLTPLLTSSEVDAARAKLPSYRAPGG